MSIQTITTMYLALIAIELGTSLTLELLNLRELARHSTAVPTVFSKTIDDDSYQKGIRYTREKTYLSIFNQIISALVLVALVVFGIPGMIDRITGTLVTSVYAHGLLFIFLLTLLFWIVELPLALYSMFGIEERYGFNRTTFRQWVIDTIKSGLVSVLLGAPLLLGLFWFIETMGSAWWVYAFLFIAAFQLSLMYLYPVVIAPLFNKFTPLEDGALQQRIFEIAKQANFATSGIFVMDGSKRSAHANAYFTGFGKNKRIVLFDTLLQTLSSEQTVAVLAHEIGHEKRHHIKKMLLLSLGMLLFSLWLVSVLLNYPPLFHLFGLSGPSPYGAVVVLSFAASPLTFFSRH